MSYSLLESGLEKEIVPVIQKLIRLSESEIVSIYRQMRVAKESNDWWKCLPATALHCDLSSYEHCIALGIDFPIWFNWETDKKKTMIIGRDPQRSQGSKELVLSSPFGLVTAGARNTNRNKYWDFVEPLLEDNRIYITDLFKLFFRGPIEDKKRLKKNLDFHHEILKMEIGIIRPKRIITIGKDAEMAIRKIYDCKECNSHEIYWETKTGEELFFIPHISNRVLQNVVPVARLFKAIGKLNEDETMEKVGADMLLKYKDFF